MARAEIGEDVLSTIRNVVLCPGQVQHHPVLKSRNATLDSHHKPTGSQAPVELPFRSIVT